MIWLYFMIIMQVTNKIFMVFFTKPNLASLVTLIFFQYLLPLELQDFYGGKTFPISISPNVKISLPLFIRDNKFLYFMFFLSNRHFVLGLWPHFCDNHGHNILRIQNTQNSK